MTLTTIVKDRNETKFLFAVGFVGIPISRDRFSLDFAFSSSSELDEARRGYALNRPVPVLSFIGASKWVDSAIQEHRLRNTGTQS